MLYAAENDFGYVSLDVETDSTSEKKAKLYGVGLSFQDNEAFYIPIRNKDGSKVWEDETVLINWIYDLSKNNLLIGHNIIYDVLVIENNWKIDLTPFIHADTILMKHCIDEERPFGLKETSVKYLGPWADKAQERLFKNIEENGGSTTKDNLEMYKADTNILGEYCGHDVVLTRKLFDLFSIKLKEENLENFFYVQEVMPLYKEVTIDMKRKGFPVDVKYFEKLKQEIDIEILAIEKKIHAQIEPFVKEFSEELLEKEFPVKRTGNFPKMLAQVEEVPLPMKEGKVTLAKKEIEKMASSHEHIFYDWILGNHLSYHPAILKETQKRLWKDSNPDQTHIFNLRSNDHLAYLLFDALGELVEHKTETGKPQVNDDVIEGFKDKYKFIQDLLDLKKLSKLESTYVSGILERQIDGVIYTSYLMFGTTSGRFSSTNPNIQNLPRIKKEDANLSPLILKYTNAIKKGFIAPEGYKIVNADYSALEPRCFAHVSNEESLREVFRRGYDLYSTVAIDVFNIEGCSADPKAPNYLGHKYPEKRQLAKAFCLAVVYGAEAPRISGIIGCEYQEAQEIIDKYLDAYPNLKKYMDQCDFMATKKGYVTTEFGRIRHLPKAKDLHSVHGMKLLNRKYAKQNGLDEVRYIFKNMLNLSKNHPIQGLAAHIVNRSLLQYVRSCRQKGIEVWIAAQTHDEITTLARSSQVAEAVANLKYCMEGTVKLSLPLKTEPVIGNNWGDSK